jgi:hypothetical protein
LKANIGRILSKDCPFVSGRHKYANGTKKAATQPKKSNVPPAPKTSGFSIHGVSMAETLFAGPQFTKVHSPTALPRTRSGIISGI